MRQLPLDITAFIFGVPCLGLALSLLVFFLLGFLAETRWSRIAKPLTSK
jgi:hypothetical protein